MTGRGFLEKSSALNLCTYKKTNIDKRNLDQGNRFFEDNRRIYETYVLAERDR